MAQNMTCPLNFPWALEIWMCWEIWRLWHEWILAIVAFLRLDDWMKRLSFSFSPTLLFKISYKSRMCIVLLQGGGFYECQSQVSSSGSRLFFSLVFVSCLCYLMLRENLQISFRVCLFLFLVLSVLALCI